MVLRPDYLSLQLFLYVFIRVEISGLVLSKLIVIVFIIKVF